MSLELAFAKATELISDQNNFVRAVLSGRRRNMQTEYERIDIRPVQLKDGLRLQLILSEEKQDTTKNIGIDADKILELLNSGYANVLVEFTTGSYSLRITKKGEALIHEAKGVFERSVSHDRTKERLLDASDPFLIEVGISDHKGSIKPSMQDKYRQVEEFLRILEPALPEKKEKLSIVDLGCGHAYLTFATHQYLRKSGIDAHVIGIDVRENSRDRNNAIAKKLGITDSIEFRAEEISETKIESADIAIALHACDTATDDAIAWGVQHGVQLLLIAPCCHHDLQVQIQDIPEPWPMLTRHGIMRERLGDLLTDSFRTQILKLLGYRVDAIEFVGGEHTPRNLMIRATKTGAKPEPVDIARYKEMLAQWNVNPALAQRLAKELGAI
ncbi:methyltransferase [Candidatus Planktophila limnetica]|uniref:Methyltransferase n=1 Tax=Candidatus Planktophila limnetica TaxID=573600 RepID=A0A249LE94_9ACTN|nr:SAM-dependent methyltransferase [Candidatus Planktophila limnetica]ASY27441.1 methyltransferase [Candidatus Planktophila limnetica]